MNPSAPTESEVAAAIRLDLAKRGVILWRNNTGVAKNEAGRPIRFGLANDSAAVNAQIKSSDLIGIARPSGKFVAIECKRPGWPGVRTERERAQMRFIAAVRSFGGLAGFATSPADAMSIIAGGVGAKP